MSGRQPQNPNRGFSLVELMVALVISLILLGGVIKIYESSKQAYRAQDNQARLQENGRFAMYFLAKDIRMAGYMGCNQLSQIHPNVIANNPPMTPLFSAETVIGGYDGGTWPASFPAKPANLVAGTDAILVRHASSTSVSLTGNLSGDTAKIQIGSNPGNYQAGDILFITNCSHADIFRATSVSKGTGGIITIAHASNQNTSNRLSKPLYKTDAQVMAFEYSLYYIRTTATPGVDALYRVTANSAPEELVDGVRNMQFLYGLDTTGNGSADEYRTASEVNAMPVSDGWPAVVSVRVSLLLVSQGKFLTQTRQELRFNGATYKAPDNRMYAAFGDTVTLRNRIP
jgi:type IV pilus assembly protein PilW